MRRKFLTSILCMVVVCSLVIILPSNKAEESNDLSDFENTIDAKINITKEPTIIKPIKKEISPIKIDVHKPSFTMKRKIIYVDDDFTDDPANHKWNTIKEGLEDAEDGDTIRIYDGTYHEYDLIVNKSISIIGNGSATIVDGGKAEWKNIFHILADNVYISNLKIINSDDDAIEVESANNISILNCEFENNVAGIFLSCSSNDYIGYCTFQDNVYGIYLVESEYADLQYCDFINNTYGAFFSDSNYGNAEWLNFNSNEIGLYLDDSYYLNLRNSSFISNTEYGLYGHRGKYADIRDCNFSNNKFGFYIAHGGGSILRNNVFNNNVYNFGNWGSLTSDFNWDIDTSNTINGKPIYYIIGESGLVFDETMDIGFLALISCDNIIVRNLSLGNNFNGLVVVDTEYSTIENCTISNCYWTGILLGRYSKYNTIKDCHIHHIEERPIYMWSKAENNLIENCVIHDATIGIYTFGKNNEISNCSIYNCSNRAIGATQVITIKNCSIWNNHWGINLSPKSGTTLKNNSLWNNDQSLGFHPSKTVSNYNMDIDTSNTVDGKPVYYIIGESGLVFDETMDIGFLALISCDNIIVRNVTIHNNYLGIYLVDTTDSEIINCTVYNCHYAIGITADSTNNLIKDCKSFNNSHGIFIYDASANTVMNCQSYNNNYGIWIHYCPLPANVLRNNTLWNNTQNFVMRGGSVDEFRQDIDTSNIADGKPAYHIIDADGLTFDGIAVGWLALVNCSNIIVSNIEFSHNDQAILLVNTVDSVISNCIAHDTSRGISLYYDSNNNVIENCISYNNGYGIYFYSSSDNNQIINCHMYNNSIGIYGYKYATNHVIENCAFDNNTEGIMLYYYSNNNLISNCTFYNNEYGIDLYYKNNFNEIRDCVIVDNEIGIDLYYYTSSNTVENCNISHNSVVGVRIYKSTGNIIVDNYLMNNYYAIYIYSSSTSNSIYHNFFINNAVYKHVRDECGNSWDNGYPSGGNLWSDYKGKDEYQGPNQDLPGSDGIGDTPYIILGGCPMTYTQDNYPLINPPPNTWIDVSNAVNGYISPTSVIVIRGEDDEISGYRYYIHYRIDGGAEQVGGLNENIWLQITTPGCHILEYWGEDAWGALEEHHNVTLFVDAFAPTTKISFNPPVDKTDGYYYITTDTQIQFSAVDNGAGVKATYYRINESWLQYTQPFNLEAGEYTIDFYSVDLLGNQETAKTVYVIVTQDLAPLTTCNLEPSSPNGNNGWYITDVMVSFEAIDEDGVKATYYRINGGQWKEYTKPLILDEDGIYTIEYYSIDNLGLKEDSKTIVIRIDKTISLDVSKPENAIYIFDREIIPFIKPIAIGKLTIKAEVVEEMSGIDESYIEINGVEKARYKEEISYTWNEFAIGKQEIRIVAYDMAGNKAAKTIEIVIFNMGLGK